MASRSGSRGGVRPVALGFVALVALTSGLYACSDSDSGGAASESNTTETVTPAEDITYVSLDPATFITTAELDMAVLQADPPDMDVVNGHAWDLWKATTERTGQVLNGTDLAVFDTWYSDGDVYMDAGDVKDPHSRDLDPLNQSLHHGSLANEPTTTGDAEVGVMSFNRFSREMRDHIHQNQLYDSDVLNEMQQQYDKAALPIQDRVISEFSNTSVMTKPVWWIVSGDSPSMMPYWDGTGSDATTDAHVPAQSTWKKCVLIDPTSGGDQDELKKLGDVDRTCNKNKAGETAATAGTYPVKSVSTDASTSDFYAFELTQDEVDGLGEYSEILNESDDQGTLREVVAGDYAVLVAMHISTKEQQPWTWQTFWWSPTPERPADSPPDAQSPPKGVDGPFALFDMCTAYSITESVGTAGSPNRICFNPYIESDLTGLFNADGTVSNEVGVNSNCMSCHQAAVYNETSKSKYVAAGVVSTTDPQWFANNLKTDFLWSIPFKAHKAPFVDPQTSAPPTTVDSSAKTTVDTTNSE